jgi:hypothetical protein
MVTFVKKIEPLSAEHTLAFEALMKTTPDTVATEILRYVDGLSAYHPDLRSISIRDFLARSALANGKYNFDVPRVLVEDINRLFGGMVSRTHPGRIRVVPGAPPAPSGTTVQDLSGDFKEYVKFVSQGDSGIPFPYALHNEGKGLVVAGGCVLSEILLPESMRKSHSLQYVNDQSNEDVLKKSFDLKGPITDIDNFITVPHRDEVTHEELTDAQRKDAACSLAIKAVKSASKSRFVHTETCMLCGTEVLSNMHTGCSKGHIVHTECFRDSQTHNCMCVVPSCGVCMQPSIWTGLLVNANRSTINVSVPSFRARHNHDQRQVSEPIWQLTSRVFPSVDAVTASFDFAVAMCTYDGVQAWTTELGAFGIANGVMLVSPFHMSSTCEMRTVKYVSRYGFDLLIVGTNAAEYDAMVVSGPMRGIRGIKWLVNDMQARTVTLKTAWTEFCRRIKQAGTGIRLWFDSNGHELPLKYMVAYSRPYDAAGKYCSFPEEGSRSSNTVDMQTMDMVRLLSFITFEPGRQLFIHANAKRMKPSYTAGAGADAECMQMWDPSFAVGVFV